MSSANPLPAPPSTAAPATGAEKKLYEPSMEEILASIRRIIADDQSLPGRGMTSEAFASPLTPRVEPSAPADPAAVAPVESSPAAEPRPAPAAYGAIAAPQFATPHPVAPPHVPSAEAQPAASEPSTVIDAPHFAAEPASSVAPAPDVESPAVGPEPQLPAAAHKAPPATDVPAAFGHRVERHEASPPAEADFDAPITPDEDYGSEPPYAFVGAAEEDVRDLEPPHPTPAEPSAGLFSAATDSSVASAFNMLAASRLADNSDELMNLAREMIRPLLRTWIDDNLPSMVERMVRAEIERVARGGR